MCKQISIDEIKFIITQNHVHHLRKFAYSYGDIDPTLRSELYAAIYRWDIANSDSPSLTQGFLDWRGYTPAWRIRLDP